jgi:hypothetical protein
VIDKSILIDFILHQGHEVFSIFDSEKNVAINFLLPTRVFQDILLLAPKLLTKMRRKNSLVLNIEDYSVLEKSTFNNALKFLKTVLNLRYKPFRLNKVIIKLYISSITFFKKSTITFLTLSIIFPRK